VPDTSPAEPGELSAEDAKLVTLARGARARAGSAEGAAVRDGMGRTYAAGGVELAALRLSALQAAVAAAVSSGSDRFEAAVVVSAAQRPSAADVALLQELGAPAPLLVSPAGSATALG
jgi:cytidine deaminase